MSEIYLLPANERQFFFDTAAVESGISPAILESDPERARSKKKQKAALESLGQLCSAYVQERMLESLKQNIADKLGTMAGWRLTIDPKDPDGQTLLFDYPTQISRGGYIEPSVKIEMGARAEHWPVSQHRVRSYLKDTLKEKVIEEEVLVRVLNAERTFWEKATILHQYAHFPENRVAPRRISRHFYDFGCLLGSDIKAKALEEISLLERVAKHKSIYFPSGWANYETARRGSLRLLPQERIMTALESDYELMASMFFRERPDWMSILKTIGEFEAAFNS